MKKVAEYLVGNEIFTIFVMLKDSRELSQNVELKFA